MVNDLICNQVSQAFGARQIFDDVSFAAKAGETTIIIGPNGTGKTSLLDILTGEALPMNGDVKLGGVDISSVPPDVVRFVHQQSALFPDLTVGETVRLWGTLFGRLSESAMIVPRFGLDVVEQTLVKKLSGGEQQRLRLGLATIGHADFYVLDEPTNNLDADARSLVCEVAAELTSRDAVVIVATHDIELLAEVPGPIQMLLAGSLTSVRSAQAATSSMTIDGESVQVSDFASLEQIFSTGRKLES